MTMKERMHGFCNFVALLSPTLTWDPELTLLITTQILLLLGLKDKPEPPATEETDQADEGVDNAENNDKTEKENQPLPEFGQYLYFLFCPTLIYWDQYPM